jgi:hypothetical protein
VRQKAERKAECYSQHYKVESGDPPVAQEQQPEPNERQRDRHDEIAEPHRHGRLQSRESQRLDARPWEIPSYKVGKKPGMAFLIQAPPVRKNRRQRGQSFPEPLEINVEVNEQGEQDDGDSAIEVSIGKRVRQFGPFKVGGCQLLGKQGGDAGDITVRKVCVPQLSAFEIGTLKVAAAEVCAAQVAVGEILAGPSATA